MRAWGHDRARSTPGLAGRASAGAAPVTLYSFTGGGRRPRGAGPAPAWETQQAADPRAAFDAIENLHRQEIIAAVPPVAPAPAPVDQAAIYRWHEQQALAGLSTMPRSDMTTGRQRIAELAQRDINAAITRGLHEQAQLQAWLDWQWRGLLANDPDIVLATLTGAVETSRARVAVTGVENGEASVVVIAPGIGAVPERMPQLTPAGDLSMATITPASRNTFYLKLICGHVLLAVREALAVAPGLGAVRVAVLRQAPPGAYGIGTPECLLAALFTRQRLTGVPWHSATSIQIVQDTSIDLRARLTRTGEPIALDLAAEPALAALLQVVDTSGDGRSGSTSVLDGNRPDRTARSPRPMAGAAPPPRPPVAPTLLAGPGPAPARSRSGRQTKRARVNTRYAALITAGAVVLLVIIALGSSHGTATPPTDNASAVAVSTPTVTASPSPTPRATKAVKARPKETASSAGAVTPPPGAITPAALPSSPAAAASHSAATASASCHPVSDKGTCYKPGETCRNSDHGNSGVTASGEAIICQEKNGWRWEQV